MLQRPLSKWTKKQFKDLIAEHEGNVNAAAKAIGQNRMNLRYWIEKHPDIIEHIEYCRELHKTTRSLQGARDKNRIREKYIREANRVDNVIEEYIQALPLKENFNTVNNNYPNTDSI